MRRGGNRKCRCQAGFTYKYDAENRLAKIGGYTYTYDGDGNRVLKANSTSNTSYWRGPTGDPLFESSLTGTNQSEYIFFNGQRIARRDLSSPTLIHYYFSDHLGTHGVVDTVSSTGTITTDQDIDYYPYGGVEHDFNPNLQQHYRFTGKERDGESSLDYFGARHYASSLGRYMRPDDPFADQHPRDPQSWNLYSYVRNNPLNATDPSGHECVSNSSGGWEWSGSGETCEDVDAQNEEYRQSGQASATVNGCEGEGAADCLGAMVSDLTSTSSLSEVGVNGMLWAGSARAAWDLGALGLSWALGRASGEMIQGLYGPVSRATLEAAASSGGSTVRVVCTLDAAPAAGKALSTATGAGADALANAAGGGAKYVANIPSALVQTMENAGLVTRSTTSMGGAVATELKFARKQPSL